MVFIKKGILQSELIGVTPRLKHALRESLKYEDKKHIIARLSARKRLGYIPKRLSWSGVTYLINEKNEFPSGLLARVFTVLNDQNLPYQILNDFEPFPATHILPLQQPLNLWEHQRDAVEAIKTFKTGIINIAPGGGKTKLSIVACSEISQFPFLFVVNRLSLLNQTHDDYTKYFNEPIGYLGDGRVEPQSKINIASIGTLCSMLNINYKTDEPDGEKLNYSLEQIKATRALMAQCKFVIIDECHHSSSGTYKTLMKGLSRAFYRVGLSGTPFRTDESENILLEAALGQVIYKKSSSELIRDNILAKPKIYFVRYKDTYLSEVYPETPKKLPVFAKVYKECVVENERFNEIISKCAIANADLGRLTLVSVNQINHGNLILENIQKISPNTPTKFLHGKNKKEIDENRVKEDFSAGKIKILISTLFNEGVDIPRIDAVVDAGGGSSPIKALQLTGRAMRLYEGKTTAFIFMFIQPYTFLHKHSLLRKEILSSEPEFAIKTIEWKN